MAYFHVCTPFPVFVALCSLTQSSTGCHRFPLFCLLVLCIHFLQLRAFVLMWHSDTTGSPTEALPQRIDRSACPHPRSNPRRFSSSSDPLYAGSILTLTTVESRLLPVVRSQTLGRSHSVTSVPWLTIHPKERMCNHRRTFLIYIIRCECGWLFSFFLLCVGLR